MDASKWVKYESFNVLHVISASYLGLLAFLKLEEKI